MSRNTELPPRRGVSVPRYQGADLRQLLASCSNRRRARHGFAQFHGVGPTVMTLI